MDGYLSKKTVHNVVELLESSQRRKKMVNNNYQIAARHYSYSVLRSQLTAILKTFFGDAADQLNAKTSYSKQEGYLSIDPQVITYKRYSGLNCRISKH